MNFSETEKIAIGKVMKELMEADGKVEAGEVNYLVELNKSIGLSPDLLEESDDLTFRTSLTMLRDMDEEKKEALELILGDMALADGHFAEEEYTLIFNILSSVGIDLDA